MSYSLITITDDAGTKTIRVDDLGSGVLAHVNKLAFGGVGVFTEVDAGHPLPVTDAAGATETTLGALLTELQQKLETGGAVSISNFPGTQAVSGPLTDAELRATAITVTGALTDAQLRATPVPVSGTFYQVTQPVSASALPLPSGASTAANQATEIASLASVDTKLSNQATATKQDTGNTSLGSIDTKTPALSSGRVPVDGSGVTQPVSGTFYQATQPVSGTFWQATQPISGNVGITGTPAVDTELPAAAALADATVNPSAPAVGSFVHSYNGATWDRARGDTTNGLDVDVTRVGGTVATQDTIDTASGTITTQNLVPAGAATASSAVEITLTGASTIAIQVTGVYTGALSLQVTADGSTWVTLAGVPLLNLNTGGYLAVVTSALASVFQAQVAGFVKARLTGLAAMTGTATVTLRAVKAPASVTLGAQLPTGTNSIGNINSLTSIGTSITPGTTSAQLGKAEDAATSDGFTGVAMLGVRRDTPATQVTAAADYCEIPVSGIGSLWNTPTPNTQGGLSIGRLISAATTNATSLKASAGQVYSIYVNNLNAAARYIKFYNKASAPTVGTDTPVATFAIPAGGALNITSDTMGLAFATGIAYALTTGIADADTGAVSASEHSVVIGFK